LEERAKVEINENDKKILGIMEKINFDGTNEKKAVDGST